MVLKPRIRNEDRFAYRANVLAGIAADILALLRELYPAEEGMWEGIKDQWGNDL